MGFYRLLAVNVLVFDDFRVVVRGGDFTNFEIVAL